MSDVFLCYSRSNEGAATGLAEDIRALGYSLWYDREVSGGQEWWDQILARIRESGVFILALSPRSLESEACKREYTYAAELGRPILPVVVESGISANLLPPILSGIQFVDYTVTDRNAGLRLARALSSVPTPGPLPDPLPPEPPVPVSYLGGLTERIQAEQELTFGEQSSLLVDLRRALGDQDTRADALTLASKFRRRRDLLAVVADDLDAILGDRLREGRSQPMRGGTGPGRDGTGNPLDRPSRRGESIPIEGRVGIVDFLRRPENRNALLLQVFVGAGLFLANPRASRRWIYPLAIILGIWGFSLAPSGLDIDLGGRLDTTLDGIANSAFTIGGLTHLAGIADLLSTLVLRKRA